MILPLDDNAARDFDKQVFARLVAKPSLLQHGLRADQYQRDWRLGSSCYGGPYAWIAHSSWFNADFCGRLGSALNVLRMLPKPPLRTIAKSRLAEVWELEMFCEDCCAEKPCVPLVDDLFGSLVEVRFDGDQRRVKAVVNRVKSFVPLIEKTLTNPHPEGTWQIRVRGYDVFERQKVERDIGFIEVLYALFGDKLVVLLDLGPEIVIANREASLAIYKHSILEKHDCNVQFFEQVCGFTVRDLTCVSDLNQPLEYVSDSEGFDTHEESDDEEL